eukprot:scaffold5524_cov175-Amphora_coffeaeformis.AAC.7
MRLSPLVVFLALWPTLTSAFVPAAVTKQTSSAALPVSIGLGPEESTFKSAKDTLVAGVDYEIPNHEEYRLSRRSKLDAECDEWFQTLLEGDAGCLGDVATAAKTALETPPPLVNDIEKPVDDPEWTPYVSTRLPWTPLTPAFGTEVYGLPTPRRNAETWRHFDVTGMVRKQYPLKAAAASDLDYAAVQTDLQAKGAWLDDDACQGRLVYINGIFVPELSKTTEWVTNLDAPPTDKETVRFLSRLTDGFTDELACPVPCNDEMLTSYKKLSGPGHSLGEPYSQFAINAQQGTACFAALNTYKTTGVAHVHCPAQHDAKLSDHEAPQPVLIVNAQTGNGGVTSSGSSGSSGTDAQSGVAYHPRTLVVAEDGARLSVVQSSVDLDSSSDFRPKLYNGYTQVFVKGDANVTHSYLEESSGIVTRGVERSDDSFAPGETTARVLEAARPALQDSHLEAIDVHVMGEKGAYQGAVMALGASGHSRVALSVSLLQSEAFAAVNGFSLAGGAQRADIKTNIHHIAQGTSSRQLQKNMIGGRATGSFRGRIRVERSAQQTDSEQLSRTILLSDKARAWAVPSLEIIADDVQCAHGATVSDLSEEELFYLRSRGLDRATSRNMLMYAFAEDIAANVDPAMLGDVDGQAGLQKRIIRRLENLVPQGERAVKGEFQSI